MDNMEVKVVPNKDGELVIRTGDAVRIYHRKGLKYAAYSTDSLIALIISKGSKDNSIIAYSDDGVEVILDDTVHDRDQDRLEYSFKHSQQYREWEKILNGVAIDQKAFIKFLQRREPDEVEGIEILMAALQNFKFVTNITGDFTYDDRNNYTFSIKIGEAEGTMKLPQMILANIEIFNESQFVQQLEIEVEVVKPRSEGEKPTFLLTCPKLARYKRAAVEHEIGKLYDELDGYLIVTGQI